MEGVGVGGLTVWPTFEMPEVVDSVSETLPGTIMILPRAAAKCA
jgi:hypothetical protein